MKVAVKQLRPNPFRNLSRCPVNDEKIEALKTSMRETTFWDNILARPTANDAYEIAYGHHRLQALQELRVEMVDIPIRELDDATMIRIMANENMQDWDAIPAVINETVGTAKSFLDDKLRISTWATLEGALRSLFTDSRGYENAKKHGVGRAILRRFLGANWTDEMIQEALNTLDMEQKGLLNRVAVELLPTISHGREFKAAVRQLNLPVNKQIPLARHLVEIEIPSRQVEDEIVQCWVDVTEVEEDSEDKVVRCCPVFTEQEENAEDAEHHDDKTDEIEQITYDMEDLNTKLADVEDQLQSIASIKELLSFRREACDLRDVLIRICSKF